MNYRQKDQPEWLATAYFSVNNKTHSATKVSLFMVNYEIELEIEANVKRKEKVENITEFAERMKKVQEKAGTALKKVQEEIKRQADKGRRKVKK